MDGTPVAPLPWVQTLICVASFISKLACWRQEFWETLLCPMLVLRLSSTLASANRWEDFIYTSLCHHHSCHHHQSSIPKWLCHSSCYPIQQYMYIWALVSIFFAFFMSHLSHSLGSSYVKIHLTYFYFSFTLASFTHLLSDFKLSFCNWFLGIARKLWHEIVSNKYLVTTSTHRYC